jgi:hypothetical protein
VTALILTGTVVTYDDDQPVVKGGAVYIGDGGVIDAVQPARRTSPAGFSKARKGVVMRLPEELLPGDPALRAEANLSWADGRDAMQRVVDDPAKAVRRAREAADRRPRGAPIPLQYEPDMPGPDGSAGAGR